MIIVALAACQGPSTSQPPPSPASEPATLARQAFDRQDWSAAAPLFRAAIERDATNLELHYKLAITASYLSRIDEAVHEFTWVLAHASEASEEARIARQWLGNVRSDGATTASAGAAGGSRGPRDETREGDSGISGVVTWAEAGNRPEPKQRMQVHLIAQPGQQTVAEQRFTARTDQDGQYAFKQIPAGTYKLTNTVAGQPLWRLRVTIEQGRETTLDLNNANSLGVRDDFPDRG